MTKEAQDKINTTHQELEESRINLNAVFAKLVEKFPVEADEKKEFNKAYQTMHKHMVTIAKLFKENI